MVLPAEVFAQSGGTGGGSGGTGGGSGGGIVLTNPIGVDTIPAVLDRIINFMIVLAGPIAVIMLIYAGYLFVVGGGSEEKVKTARRIILGVVIGIAILVLSKALVYVTCNVLGTSCVPSV